MIKKLYKTSNVFNKNFLKNKFVKFTIKLLITFGVIYFLYENISLSEIVNQIKNSNQYFLISAILLGLFNIFIQYLKWKITVHAVLEIKDNKKIISSLLQGLAAAVSTPARVGEYVGRALPFTDKSFLQVTLATLVDKFFSIIIVVVLGAFSSLLFIKKFYNVFQFLIFPLVIILLIFFYLTFHLLFNEKFWDNLLFNKIRDSEKFGKYYKKFEVLKRLDKHYKSKMLLLSLLLHLCILVQYSFLVMAFSHNNQFLNYLWAGNLIMFTKTVIPSITIGEFGMREIASVYFIQQVGEDSNIGFNASIFLFIINLILPAIFGILYQFRKNNE